MDATPSGSQADHHITSKADFIRTVKADPTAAINNGMLEQKKQEIPFGGVGKAIAQGVERVVGKVTAKDTAKNLTENEQRFVGAVKDMAKKSPPGTVTARLSEANLEGRQASSRILRKAAGDRTEVNKPSKQATPDEIKIRNKRTGKLVSYNPNN